MVILRDQAEECPLHWLWSNIPKWSSKLIIEPGQSQPNEAQVRRYNLSLEDMVSNGMNPDSLD